MVISDTETGYGLGKYLITEAFVPGVPTFSSNGTGTISFTVAENNNVDTVTYAIQCAVDNETPVGYLDASGNIDDVAETWQTAATWGTYFTASLYGSAAINASHYYKFRAKAQNTELSPTAFSAWSKKMIPYRRLAEGPLTDATNHIIYSGNTHISLLTMGGTSKAIPFTFTLTNKESTASRIAVEFKRDGESSYTAATDFFTVASTKDILNFTSSSGGPVAIDVDDGSYNSGTALATELQSKMNANTTLTGSGHLTFTVTYSSTTGKYTITVSAGGGHTIALDYFASDGAYLFGFTNNKTAAISIESDESRGEAPNILTTSSAGVSHTFVWDTKTDLGSSFYKSGAVTFRVTPYDESPSGGTADTASTTTGVVNNLPLVMTTLVNSYTTDDDTTPTFIATMSNLVLGDYAFFKIFVYDSTGTELQRNNSAEELDGWEYETVTDTWTAMTVLGVSALYVPPNVTGLRVRYTYQEALPVGAYTIKILQAEDFSETA